MKVAVGLRRVAAGKRTSGRRAAQIALSVKKCALLVPRTPERNCVSSQFPMRGVLQQPVSYA